MSGLGRTIVAWLEVDAGMTGKSINTKMSVRRLNGLRKIA